MLEIIYPILVYFIKDKLINSLAFFFIIDTLDNEWLGQGFQEHLSALESAIEQLENGSMGSKTKSTEKPTIIITKAASSDRSVHTANEEYDELCRMIQMLVK